MLKHSLNGTWLKTKDALTVLVNITRGQSNLTKGRIVAPKIHDRSALTKPEVVFLNNPRRSDSHETIPVLLRPTVTEISRFIDFSKMAAVRHLGFAGRVF